MSKNLLKTIKYFYINIGIAFTGARLKVGSIGFVKASVGQMADLCSQTIWVNISPLPLSTRHSKLLIILHGFGSAIDTKDHLSVGVGSNDTVPIEPVIEIQQPYFLSNHLLVPVGNGHHHYLLSVFLVRFPIYTFYL